MTVNRLCGSGLDAVLAAGRAIKAGEALIVDNDEHPRGDTSVEKLSKLKTPFRENGTMTACNASGVNDGATALELKRNGVRRVLATMCVGVGQGIALAMDPLLDRPVENHS